jgi:hypothetical protein
VSDAALGTLAVQLPIPILIVIFLIVQIRRNKLSVVEREKLRARSRLHRRGFAAYIRRVGRLSPCNAALELELDRRRPWYSTVLVRPQLAELFPAEGSNDIAAAHAFALDLIDDAMRVAHMVWQQKTDSERHAAASLRSRFPEFSRRSVDKALSYAWYVTIM